MNNSEECIKEGQALIKKYNTTFYNPAQQTNRDISVAVIKEYFKYKDGFKILDAMSATGLRGIRYLKEIGNSKVYFNDINVNAINCIKENIIRNEFDEKEIEIIEGDLTKTRTSNKAINIINSDCNLLMCSLTGFFDVIDIDPFGGCSPYIDNAFRAIKHNGLLCFTCTDKAALCSKEDKCWVKYSTTILKGFAKHETPLRVLLSLISRQAAKFDCSIEPLVSLSLDFYIRVFVRVIKRQPKASITTNSMYFLCNCSNFKRVPTNNVQNDISSLDLSLIESNEALCEEIKRVTEKAVEDNKAPNNICPVCNSKMKLCGPFWSGPLHDTKFISNLLLHNLDRRCTVILNYLLNEIDFPFYYEMTALCSRNKFPCVKLKEILYALQNLSFESSPTHCEISGFKTTAPMEIIDCLIKLKYEDKDSPLFTKNELIEKRMSPLLKKGVLISHMGPLALPDAE